MAHTINWFEIPAGDIDRAVKFYSTIMGFAIYVDTIMGSQMGFFPAEKGEISGAVISGDGYEPGERGTLVYLNGGDDLENVLSKVEGASGKVIQPKTKISDEHGFYALFLDSEGNKVGLHSLK